MAITRYEKAARFRALHDGPGAFVIPNPWDVGSARLLAGLGFQALATTSAASASALGRKDGELTRDEALAHARLIVNATDLPVSADLEKRFGDAPEVVAETIRLAAMVGLVGCTIESATRNQDRPLYDFGLAVERIAAAAQAAHALPFPFVLTARAHNLLHAPASLSVFLSPAVFIVALSEAMKLCVAPWFTITMDEVTPTVIAGDGGGTAPPPYPASNPAVSTIAVIKSQETKFGSHGLLAVGRIIALPYRLSSAASRQSASFVRLLT